MKLPKPEYIVNFHLNEAKNWHVTEGEISYFSFRYDFLNHNSISLSGSNNALLKVIDGAFAVFGREVCPVLLKFFYELFSPQYFYSYYWLLGYEEDSLKVGSFDGHLAYLPPVTINREYIINKWYYPWQSSHYDLRDYLARIRSLDKFIITKYVDKKWKWVGAKYLEKVIDLTCKQKERQWWEKVLPQYCGWKINNFHDLVEESIVRAIDQEDIISL